MVNLECACMHVCRYIYVRNLPCQSLTLRDLDMKARSVTTEPGVEPCLVDLLLV